jgi:CHAD domain-containing protein
MQAVIDHAPTEGKVCQHLAASLAGQWKRYDKWLRRCQKRLSEAAVHQLRIEARRLPASLELLRALVSGRRIAKAQRLLKKHLDTFDELRDLHIQLRIVSQWTRRYVAASALQEHLRKREKRCEKRLRRQVQSLRTDRLGRFIQGFVDETIELSKSRPGQDHDAKVLGAVHDAFAKVMELKARLRRSHPDTIHRTRIAFKRYRYMMATLASILPRLTEKQLARMHAYQTSMGSIQDLEVLIASLAAFARKRSQDAQAIARFRTALRRRQQVLIAHYLKIADKMETFQNRSVMKA